MIQILAILPILLLFLLGYVLKKIRFFSDGSINQIKRIVTELALPALLFRAFSSLSIEGRYLIMVPLVYLVCVVMVSFGKLLAKFLKIKSPYFPILMGGFEMGMFGYALIIAFYGQEHLGKSAFIALGQVFFVFSILVSMLFQARDGKQTPWTLLSRLLKSPIIWGVFAGLIVGALRNVINPTPFFTSMDNFLALLGGLTVPLIAITIGYGIQIKKTGLLLSLATIAIRKSLLLVFALLINHYIVDGLLNMESMYRYALLLMFLTPPPFIISILARDDEYNSLDYVSNTISLDSLISVFLVLIATTIYV
jgi:malate permease and related proteins